MTLSPLGLARVQEKGVVPGDAGVAGHDGEVRLGPQPVVVFSSSTILELAQQCMKSRGAGQVGGWRDWGVGDAKWWVGLRAGFMTCWRSVNARPGGQSNVVGGGPPSECSPDHLEWVPELVSHSCNK